MTEDTVHLLTGGDEGFLPGILVASISALSALGPHRPAIVHILDGGLTNAGRLAIEKTCRNWRSEVRFHSIDTRCFSGFRPGHAGSTMYYARLHMGSFVDASRVIYFDSDMLIQTDLSSLWDRELDAAIALVAPDRKVVRLAEDCPWPLTLAEKSGRYFNSGFLLIDLDAWRSNGLERICLDLAAQNPDACHWHDQTILNYVLRTRTGWLDPAWNWQYETLPAGADYNAHFTSRRKPWLFRGPGLRYRLWRTASEIAGISFFSLFLHPTRWAGWTGGFIEEILRRTPPLRRLYSSVLPRQSPKRAYYTTGEGGPAGDAELKNPHPAIEALKDRLNRRRLPTP